MSRLLILGDGISTQAQAQSRGKLFEQLMADVLRKYGYKIDRIPSVNYSGMEIDIEGSAIATGIPLYAECKFYETEIDSPKFQAFFGKYTARYFRDPRSQGLFIAVPGLNSHAKGFYKDYCETNQQFTVRLLEEDLVLDAIVDAHNLPRIDEIQKCVPAVLGRAGDCLLAYTDLGLFWIQLIVSPGSSVADSYMVLTDKAVAVSQRQTLDRLAGVYPELNDVSLLAANEGLSTGVSVREFTLEEVVEVRGSSGWFEYQFPASPEHFVGRRDALLEVENFAHDVLAKRVSARGILFEANSGWGKSSLVLAAAKRLRDLGHYAIAFDCRSISSSPSILRVVDHALGKFSGRSDLFGRGPVTGFDGAQRLLAELGRDLEQESRLAVIFLDQFENLFFLPDVLKRVRDLLLALCDAQSNVVLGFSWKTDLIGATRDFPYQLRDSIVESSKHIFLQTFSDVETNALLEELVRELRTKLRKDLRFFLSEFSQGYPWLLKKLCAHVKSQREEGVPQSEIAGRLLNIEELFQEDLNGLSAQEQDALYRIAKVAPVGISELSEQFTSAVVQTLVHRRLVVQVGHKYDLYWDIFRDYLNTKKVPVQENYILRVQIAPVWKATKLLVEAGGLLTVDEFRKRAGLSQNSAYNVIRDMRMLGLASAGEGKLQLALEFAAAAKDREISNQLRNYLHERLTRNRVVSRILETLERESAMTVEELSHSLCVWCPYVSATEATWNMYAVNLANWLDLSDLAVYERREKSLSYLKPDMQLRERDISVPKRRAGTLVPLIQYTPVERVALEIVEVFTRKRSSLGEMKKSTRAKSLGMLEDLGFLRRIKGGYTMGTPIHLIPEFIESPEYRRKVFAHEIQKIASFSVFLEILDRHRDRKVPINELARELCEKLGADWKEGTASVNAKIMLDWARHTGLAPAVFARGQAKE